MKTFLKILLIAALVLIALKFSPIIMLGAVAGLLIAAPLGILGLSLVAALAGVILAFVIALSPLWIPVLIVLGLVSLFRSRDPAPPRLAAQQ